MERAYLGRLGAVVAGSTVLLTAAFVGVVAVVTGDAVGAGGRLPYYVFGGALVFVVTMLYLEDPAQSGVPIFTTTLGLSALAFVLIALGGEGAVHAYHAPNDVFGDQLVVYFLAAALVCTGTAYWSINHWREFAS